ncbi:MAG TPA: molybdenum cofactor guanylyltransferase [Terriglobales bacterium]|nr:molybdenum cofactor guanylyltransferase [Terriglobales bacterium]
MQSFVSAFVLAGGKSTRMGSDKAFLVLDGETLLHHAVQAVSAVTHQVMIVGPKSKFSSYAPVVEDIFPERGPLGGIHAALMSTATALNLVLAVDLPFIEPAFLSYICNRARETQALVVIPRAAGGWQPLCAVYRKEFGTVAEKALAAGRNKIDSLFADVSVAAIDEQEITHAGFSVDMFRNLNTQQELKEANGG